MNNTQTQEDNELHLTKSTKRVKIGQRGELEHGLVSLYGLPEQATAAHTRLSEQDAEATVPDAPTGTYTLSPEAAQARERKRQAIRARYEVHLPHQQRIERLLMLFVVLLMLAIVLGVWIATVVVR